MGVICFLLSYNLQLKGRNLMGGKVAIPLFRNMIQCTCTVLYARTFPHFCHFKCDVLVKTRTYFYIAFVINWENFDGTCDIYMSPELVQIFLS